MAVKRMRCHKCRSGFLRMKVNIFADVSVMNRSLHKAGIRDKDVRIEGVDWDRMWYCTNANCGFIERYKPERKTEEEEQRR